MVLAMRSPISRIIPRLAISKQVAMAGSRKRLYTTKPDSTEPAPPLPHRSAEHQAPAQTHEQSSPPTSEPRQPSKSGTFYKSFGSPILKCFLGALFTYQIIYWSWLKLESLEIKRDTEEEIRIEERKLVGLVKAKETNGKLAR